jgi:hypothetical protein
MSLPLLLEPRRIRPEVDLFLSRRTVRVCLFAGVLIVTWLAGTPLAHA